MVRWPWGCLRVGDLVLDRGEGSGASCPAGRRPPGFDYHVGNCKSGVDLDRPGSGVGESCRFWL